jgi:iron complex outermembrane recepter protein
VHNQRALSIQRNRAALHLLRAGWAALPVCLLLWASSVQAHVTPPEPKTALVAAWPVGFEQSQDAIVPLVLIVDADGKVSDAQIEASLSPELDSAAVHAARRFVFTPATDDGVAVAAKIRVIVRFEGQPGAVTHEHHSDTPTPNVSPETTQTTARETQTSVAEVVVQGQPQARTASERTIDARMIQAAPHRTAADLLQLVPGVFITQHGGEGKAYQIFYRGFDAVHGQDLEIWAGGAPVNDVSNIHGQGYADLNFVVPEVVQSMHVSPGTYDPRQGDFAVAGSLRLDLGYADTGVHLKATLGSFGTRRYFMAYRPVGAPESNFAAFETYATDGFGPSRAVRRTSALAQTVVELGQGLRARVLGTAYTTRYDSAGVLRLSDIESGAVDRFSTYDAKQGGDADRASVVVDVNGEQQQATWSVAPYFVLHSLRLRQNFTGFLPDTENNDPSGAQGNSEQQLNRSATLGMRTSYHYHTRWFSDSDAVEAGISARTDWIEQSQRRMSVLSDEVTLREVDASVRANDIGAYLDLAIHPLHGLALHGGLRLDGLAYAIEDRGGIAGGEARSTQGAHLGKKLSASYGVTRGVQLHLSYGEGFRSPQARSLAEGQTTPFATVQSYEAGVRYQNGRLTASLAGFRSALSEDLVFQQATARNEITPGTLRQGFSADLTATPTAWLMSSSNFTFTRAEFTASDHGFVAGALLPYSPQAVLRTDLSVTPVLGQVLQREVTSRLGLATTFLGGRPLPFGEFAHNVFLVDARAAVRVRELELGIDVFNLFNADWYDGEFVYASNFTPGDTVSLVPQRHVTVGAPRTIWCTLSLLL